MIQQPEVHVPSSDKEPVSHDEPAVKSFAEHRVIKHPQTSFIKRLWTSLFGGHSVAHTVTQEPGKNIIVLKTKVNTHRPKAQEETNVNKAATQIVDVVQEEASSVLHQEIQMLWPAHINNEKNLTRISKVMAANKAIVQFLQKMKATKKGKPYWLKSKRRNRPPY